MTILNLLQLDSCISWDGVIASSRRTILEELFQFYHLLGQSELEVTHRHRD
jgi:hypothetical protein